jgi:hypothetical protein
MLTAFTPAGTVLASIPQEIVLDTDAAWASELGSTVRILCAGAGAGGAVTCGEMLMLWLFMAQGRAWEGHPWHVYLASMPTPEMCTDPFHWGDELLQAELEGTILYTEIVQEKRALRASAEHLCRSIRQARPQTPGITGLTFASIIWARAMYVSRAFAPQLHSTTRLAGTGAGAGQGGRGLKGAEAEVGAEVGAGAGGGDGVSLVYVPRAAKWHSEGPGAHGADAAHITDDKDEDAAGVMLPLLDAFNHDHDSNIRWRATAAAVSFEAGEGGVQPGAEVFSNYGLRGNAELLCSYGFCVPDNPADTVLVKLVFREPDEKLKRHKVPRVRRA